MGDDHYEDFDGDEEAIDPARAYLIWRVDCPCGEVDDDAGGDAMPEKCAHCGRPVRAEG